MAGRQRHLGNIGRIPGGDDQAAGIRIGLDVADQIGDLVDGAVAFARPGTPLRAIDRPQLAIGVGPFVPDGDAMLLQPMDIGFAAQEPEQFIDDGFQMQLLGGDQRKALGQIEAHLMAEDGARAGAGAVALFHALVQGQFHQIEILAHFECPVPARFRALFEN